MTTPFNVFSACPVLAVPSGIAPSNGVPTGIQIVGRTYDDVTAFRIGAALERVRPWTGLAPIARVTSARPRSRRSSTPTSAAWPTMPARLLYVLTPDVDVEVAAGVADIETGEPLEPGARFRIASVTKPFVAAATLRLVEDGRLSLDDTVAGCWPVRTTSCCGMAGTTPRAITLRHLLTHTSGIYDFAADAYDPSIPGGFTAEVAKDPGTAVDPVRTDRVRDDARQALRRPRHGVRLLRHGRVPRRRDPRACHRA